MGGVDTDMFTSKLDETLPIIKEVSAQFQNPVSYEIVSWYATD